MSALFFELFAGLPRLGPGSEAETLRAIETLPPLPASPRLLDLGCGEGASTLVLARHLGGHVTALDHHRPYLATLMRRAREAGLEDRITPIEGDMAAPPFEDGAFDLLWCEAAVYAVGFEEALAAWSRLLAAGGALALSDAVWLSGDPPSEARAFWAEGYPAMTTCEVRRHQLAAAGFTPLGAFLLPPSAWRAGYYDVLKARLPAFLARHGGEAEAGAVAGAVRAEIDLFERHGQSYGYAFFMAQKR